MDAGDHSDDLVLPKEFHLRWHMYTFCFTNLAHYFRGQGQGLHGLHKIKTSAY